MTSIRLTGRTLDWDDAGLEEVSIKPDQAAEYEAQGYFIVEIAGHALACRETLPDDGDIQIQPKSDMYGRMASSGGHANMGYSGYFKGFVYLGGKRKALVDWWTLFPHQEHHYAAQQDKGKTEEAIRAIVSARSGREVTKIKGGYAFDADAHAVRQTGKAS
jgi:hypothetical protein